jgi:penicillin-binding protein 1C
MESNTVVSGASTITMQLMRLSRKRSGRSAWQKFVEIAWATRAEFRYSKDEILLMYTANAPFGGNVVGLEAAAWRYYGRPAHELTWAEAATMAVLPNAPGLIYPGRNPKHLLAKRNRLLTRLCEAGKIDSLSLHLSLAESLPGAPLPLPQLASHLMAFASGSGYNGERVATTLSANVQSTMSSLVDEHVELLSRNHIHNAAMLVLHVKTGEVIAYAGNAASSQYTRNEANDMIRTPRSSGSILKPLLYGQMVGKGYITPWQLQADIPTQYAGFAPKNYDENYSGAVKAHLALARSLNIPAVRMLKEYGVPQFHQDLNRMGFSTIAKPPAHYGLSLILGGAETTLWDLASAYRNISALVQWQEGQASLPVVHFAKADTTEKTGAWPMDAGAAWAVTEALSLVNRPEEEANWDSFAGAQRIAWKTGTSFGFRDAWAVGYNRNYVVAVWAGNASGEGRPGITGLNAAAPLLFKAFNRLPVSDWFDAPEPSLAMADICVQSGMRASERCAGIVYTQIPKASLETQACTYCRWVHTNMDGRARVHADCHNTAQMVRNKWFVLPPLQEWYYRKANPNYKVMPPWAEGCKPDGDDVPMRLIYPRDASRVFIPREIGGIRERIVLKATHRKADAVMYWHLGDTFLGTTTVLHHMEIQAAPGAYLLTIVDEDGYRFTRQIEIEE